MNRGYRALMRLAPRDLRERHGAAMEEMFAEHVAAARGHGRLATALVWLRGAADLLSARAERWRRSSVPLTVHADDRTTLMAQPLREAVSELIRDLRFAARTMLRDYVFTFAALLTLVVCLGSNAAVLSVVRSVLLRPLPFANSDRVVLLSNIYPKAGPVKTGPAAFATSAPDYFDRLDQATVFDAQAMYSRANFTVDLPTGVERVSGIRATPSFYSMLNAVPLRGGLFAAAEGEVGNGAEVILSYGFWLRAFGGADSTVGTNIRVNGLAHRVVGIMPRNFEYLWNDIDLWMPLSFRPMQRSDNARHSNNWNMIARLKPGATIEAAQRQIDAINARELEMHPEFRSIVQSTGFRTVVTGLRDEVVRDVRPALLLLWGGAVLVLMVGAVNFANLIMVRAAGRGREIAIRAAIGASPMRLARQLLTETASLTIAGGIAGIGAGWATLRFLGALHLELLPRGHQIQLDWLSTAIMLAVAILIGAAGSITPLVYLTRFSANDALHEGGRSGSSGRVPNRLRGAMAAAQVALAFILLVSAGLLLASFRAVVRIDPGFDASHVVTASVLLANTRYRRDTELAQGTTALLERVRAIPGVTAAGVTSAAPLGESFNSIIIVAEGYQPTRGEALVSPLQVTASEGYFDAMRIAIVRGRAFDARDGQGSPPVVVVDERLAQRFWPNQDPIGRRMYFPQNPQNLLATSPNTQFMTVIGVAKNVLLTGFTPRDPISGTYYLAQTQLPARTLMFAVRTSQDPTHTMGAIRSAVAGVDGELAVYGMQTMEVRVDRSLLPRRLPMLLATAFGLVALLLSAIGIYGVLANRVSQRRRELGIRLALGSSPPALLGLVLRDGIRITVIGLAIGGLGLVETTRVISRLLYGVTAADPMVIGVVTIVLVAVALVATLIPARRAARVDPITALNE